MESLDIYGRVGCSKCKIACDYFDKINMKYFYIHLDLLDEERIEELLKEAEEKKIFELPLVVYNGIMIKNYKEITNGN